MLGKRWVVNVAGILLMGNHFFISELEFIGRDVHFTVHSGIEKNQCITNKRIKAIKVCVIAKIALNDTNYEIWMHEHTSTKY